MEHSTLGDIAVSSINLLIFLQNDNGTVHNYIHVYVCMFNVDKFSILEP